MMTDAIGSQRYEKLQTISFSERRCDGTYGCGHVHLSIFHWYKEEKHLHTHVDAESGDDDCQGVEHMFAGLVVRVGLSFED